MKILYLGKILFLGRCPQYSLGRLFERFIPLRPQCEYYSYKLSRLHIDDDLAAFVILLLGILITPIIFLLETFHQPSYWFYFIFGIPFLLALIFCCMRVVKSFLIFMTFDYYS